MGRIVDGHVDLHACGLCRLRYPRFIFSGPTRLATAGLMVAVSMVANEVVLGEADDDEWRDKTGALFAARANRALSRLDLKATLLTPISDTAGRRTRFAAFRRTRGLALLRFACTYCGGRSATVSARLERREFEQSGGTITVLDDLILLD